MYFKNCYKWKILIFLLFSFQNLYAGSSLNRAEKLPSLSESTPTPRHFECYGSFDVPPSRFYSRPAIDSTSVKHRFACTISQETPGGKYAVISNDGSRIYAIGGAQNQELRILDADSLDTLGSLDVEGVALTMALSADASHLFLVSEDRRRILVFNVENPSQISKAFKIKLRRGWHVEFVLMAENTLVICSGSHAEHTSRFDQVDLADINRFSAGQNGQCVHGNSVFIKNYFSRYRSYNYRSYVSSKNLSAGFQVFSGENMPIKVDLFRFNKTHRDPETGRIEVRSHHAPIENRVALSPDQEKLALWTGSGIMLWDISNLDSPRLLTTIKFDYLVQHMFFSRNETNILFVAYGRKNSYCWRPMPRDEGFALSGPELGEEGRAIVEIDISDPQGPKNLGVILTGLGDQEPVTFSVSSGDKTILFAGNRITDFEWGQE